MKELDDYIATIEPMRKAQAYVEELDKEEGNYSGFDPMYRAAKNAEKDAESRHYEAKTALLDALGNASKQKNETLKNETYQLVFRIANSCASLESAYNQHIYEAKMQKAAAEDRLSEMERSYALALEIIAETTTAFQTLKK
jgi:hypothetical protein